MFNLAVRIKLSYELQVIKMTKITIHSSRNEILMHFWKLSTNVYYWYEICEILYPLLLLGLK